MNKQMENAAKEQEKRMQMEEMRNEILTKILSGDARERLSRIKLVRPEKAQQLESSLIKMAQNGAFNEEVSETQLVGMLEKLSDNKGETKIKIIRKRIDDDDDY